MIDLRRHRFLKLGIIAIWGLFIASFGFSGENRIDLKPLERYEDIPDTRDVKGPKLLTAQQKGAKVFFFETIVFENCTVLSDKVQKRLVEPYLNKKLCLNDINDLITAVHEAYSDAGRVLENVYFKKESFKNPGHLVVFFVEPKVSGLRIFEKKKRGRRVNSLMKVSSNEVLKVADLQCAFDILKELETFSYDLKLNTNTERSWHTADVVLRKQKKCVLGLGYDNQGSASTGRDRYTVQASFEDFLGMFEQWRFMHISTRKPFSKECCSQTSLVSLSIPYRRWRASFYGVFEQDKYPLSLKTDQVLLGVDLRYTLSRTWNSGTYIGSTLEYYSKSSSLHGNWLSVQSGDTAKLVLWGSHYRYVWGGVVYGKLSYSQGIHASDAGMGRLFDKNFKKLNVDGLFQRGFGERWKWTLSGEAQIGEPDLFRHEKFALGGMSTVRGFWGTQYESDSGYFVRNELEYLLFKRYETKCFIGYDYGHLKPSREDRLEEKTLRSFCCGVRLKVKDISFELLMARLIRTMESNRYTFLFGVKGEF